MSTKSTQISRRPKIVNIAIYVVKCNLNVKFENFNNIHIHSYVHNDIVFKMNLKWHTLGITGHIFIKFEGVKQFRFIHFIKNDCTIQNTTNPLLSCKSLMLSELTLLFIYTR